MHRFSKVLRRYLGAVLFAASAFAAEGEMELSICPAMTAERKGGEDGLFRAYEELFVERLDEWQFVSDNIAQFKFYITPLSRLLRSNPDLLEKMVASMSAMDMGVGIEVGIRHGHESLIKRTLDPITEMGGRVDFLVTDNVFVKSQFSKSTKDDYSWQSYEEAVEAYATFVAGIKEKYPNIRIGMIEAAFRFYWEDQDRFPAEGNPKKACGDLKTILEDVIAACKRKGTRLDLFQPEYSYSRIEDTENGWAKLKAMETFCRKQGMDFIFLFNDHDGGNESGALFHKNVIHCLNEVNRNGLRPSMGTIQSWYTYPEEELPEDEPYTFMHLAKAFIEICNREEGRASAPTRGRVVELFDKRNRGFKCEIIAVGETYAQVRDVQRGKTGKVRFSVLSEQSVSLLKSWATERSRETSSWVELVGKKNHTVRCEVISVGDDHVQVVHPTKGNVVKVPFSTLTENTIAKVKALQR